jgi:uncharacterized protein (TIGR03437 family)
VARSTCISRKFALLIAVFCGARLSIAQNVGFVVDNSSGVVKTVDLVQRRVASTIPSGGGASEMLILPNNQIAYVSNPNDNNLSVINLADGTLTSTIATGQGPGSLISGGDGRFVYVANDTSNDVSVIDTVSNSVVSTIAVDATPVQVNLAPSGRFLYVVNRDVEPTGTISVIDTGRRQIIRTLQVGLSPVQFAIAPTLHTAYVVNNGSNSVSIVDLDSNEVQGQIGVGSGPTGVAFSTSGQFLYVINRNSNNISVVNTATQTLIGNIGVGQQPVDMAITFDSRFGYVSNQGSNSVSVLDLSTRTTEATLAVGVQPFDLALDPNEDFLYVTNLSSQSITVIDINVDRIVSTIPIGGVPVQFTQYNYPTLYEVAPNPASIGSKIILNGEGFLPSSVVRFVTTAPPRTTAVPATWLDSGGLEVTVPSFQGSQVSVSMAHADGNSSEQITLRAGTATPFISAGGIVEGAGFQAAPYPITGGEIVSVFGGFAGITTSEATSFPLPQTLGTASVKFNGLSASHLYSSAGQINVITPIQLNSRSNARVTVSVGNQTSRAEAVDVRPVAPGVFQAGGGPAGAFLHGLRPSAKVDTADPALRGEVIIAFVTGLGMTFPLQVDAAPAASEYVSPTIEVPTVSVGGVPASVSFSGLAPGFAGLYQINFQVPLTAPTGNEVAVVVTSASRVSNAVRLAVR